MNKRITDDQCDELIAMAMDGSKDADIANHFNISAARVGQLVNQYNEQTGFIHQGTLKRGWKRIGRSKAIAALKREGIGERRLEVFMEQWDECYRMAYAAGRNGKYRAKTQTIKG